jgi:hypothetical protein
MPSRRLLNEIPGVVSLSENARGRHPERSEGSPHLSLPASFATRFSRNTGRIKQHTQFSDSFRTGTDKST